MDVSLYQMFSGALVLWVACLSVLFLRAQIQRYQWAALAIVATGVAIVGLTGVLYKRLSVHHFEGAFALRTNLGLSSANMTMVGLGCILISQLFTALQFVVEEQLIAHDGIDPLLAVGYEGLFGLILLSFITPAAYYLSKAYSSSGEPARYLDVVEGFSQLSNDPILLTSAAAFALSIALYNWSGMCVTQHVSATARSTIATCRTIGERPS